MKRTLDILFERLAIFVSASTLLVALFSMAIQVIYRYVFNDSLVWSEEVARYALIWSAMIGAAVAYRRGDHAAVVSLVARLPAALQVITARAVHLTVFGFSAALTWYGWQLTMRNFERNQLSSALEIDIAWVNLAIPVGGLLIMIAAIEGMFAATKAHEGITAI